LRDNGRRRRFGAAGLCGIVGDENFSSGCESYQQSVVFDSGIYLDADLLFVCIKALEFDRQSILAREQTGETISAFVVSNALKRSVSQSLAAEIHDDARQHFSLVGAKVSNDFAPDATALGRTGNGDKKDDYCREGSRYSLKHAR